MPHTTYHCQPDSPNPLGNGCVNDFSRTLASAVWEPLIPTDAVTIFSGGTEGVLCPHVTFIVRREDGKSTGLVGAAGRTKDLGPHEVGRPAHARAVSATIHSMMSDLKVGVEDVKLVLVKCPLLTSAKMEAARAANATPITTDTYESMAKSRYASAIGIGAALGEVEESNVEDDLQTGASHSAIASCSSGAELEDNHIFILASDPAAASESELRAISRPMKDGIDAEAALDLLGQVKQDGGQVVQIFAKAEADPGGTVRGKRHTMNTDSDIHSTRHARAAVGGLLSGLAGDTQLYVSGGAEGQGPPGGGSLCLVYRVA